MTVKLLTIVGARPQFIKAAVLSRAIQNQSWIVEDILHTGQHFDKNMSDTFFAELAIPAPKYSLNIHGGNHGQMTGRMLEAIEEVLIAYQYSAVVVYGDTNSTLAGALAAAKLSIPIIHIEAGLRSFNRTMPEEINRLITDHVSNLLFCPTQLSVDNLAKEGITKGVYHVGDIMYDAMLYTVKCANKSTVDLPQDYAFLTIHRAESTESLQKFKEIVEYVRSFAKSNHLQVVCPIHPRAKNLFMDLGLGADDIFVLTEPLSYFETQRCLSLAQYVLTDSGGLQKEAYFHRVPCITLRSETEWVETISCGWNRLWIENSYKPRRDILDYGNGDSAAKILSIISEIFA